MSGTHPRSASPVGMLTICCSVISPDHQGRYSDTPMVAKARLDFRSKTNRTRRFLILFGLVGRSGLYCECSRGSSQYEHRTAGIWNFYGQSRPVRSVIPSHLDSTLRGGGSLELQRSAQRIIHYQSQQTAAKTVPCSS